MQIPVERFIESIRKRPVLWDTYSDVYKDRMLKKDGWMEVCEIVHPKFAELNGEERAQAERDMQLKWKNLRDAYVRHIRMTMNRSKKSKPIKTYIYSDHMSFLRRVINPKTRTRRPAFQSSPKNKEPKEELTHDDLVEMAEYEVKPEMVFKKEKDEEEEELVTNVDPVVHVESECDLYENEDMNFFKSLLPTLQNLKTEQKLKFRIDVLELLMTYHQAATK